VLANSRERADAFALTAKRTVRPAPDLGELLVLADRIVDPRPRVEAVDPVANAPHPPELDVSLEELVVVAARI
jgi:hypothetical protein